MPYDSKEDIYSSLPQLNLPKVDIKFRKEDGMLKIYDPFRNKYVAFTPEEYVRRHFSEYLATELKYPRSNIANEVSVDLNGRHLRCDTLVTDIYGQPFMIVEYKAPNIKINQNTFDQIVRYNTTFKATYLVVSNGYSHYCCMIDYNKNTYCFLPEIPAYTL